MKHDLKPKRPKPSYSRTYISNSKSFNVNNVNASSAEVTPDIPLIGPANESQILVEGLPCLALIDGGSQVSTITKQELDSKHPGLTIYSIQE